MKTPGAPRVVRKWRPSLALILAGILCFAVLLPLGGVFFFRIYENQLVRQAEAELIAQSAALAAIIERRISEELPADAPLGAAVSPPQSGPDNPYRPILPALDLAADELLPSRPSAREPAIQPHPAFVALGRAVAPDLAATQQVTLAGFRLLDPFGTIIAGREEVGLSLAHVEEVAGALKGEFRAVMRLRISKHEPPPLYSLSRGAGVRVFTALPIIARGHVAAVLYASRTPSNVLKHLYDERHKAMLAALSVTVLTALAGFAFHRTLTAPIRQLMARTQAIAAGDHSAIRPLVHHGTAEFAQLSQSFLDMAASLAQRSDFIESFAAHVSHELKSPLTSIRGAAELLRDDAAEPSMTQAQRLRFLDQIMADVGRLSALVTRLRELARAETAPVAGHSTLAAILGDLRAGGDGVQIAATGDLDTSIGMSSENLRIILSHLIDNAARHGARDVAISARQLTDEVEIMVRDDGPGVSPNNRDRIFEPFFTTRRNEGGTGMGLAIVRTMIEAHSGGVDLLDGAQTTFRIVLPVARHG